MKEKITYVLCVDRHMNHTPDSLPTECVYCNCDLWVSPHHIEEKRLPICARCIKKVMDKEELDFCMDKRDIERARKEIHRRKNKLN